MLLFNEPAKPAGLVLLFLVIFNHHPGQLLGVGALLLAEGKCVTKKDLRVLEECKEKRWVAAHCGA